MEKLISWIASSYGFNTRSYRNFTELALYVYKKYGTDENLSNFDNELLAKAIREKDDRAYNLCEKNGFIFWDIYYVLHLGAQMTTEQRSNRDYILQQNMGERQ